MIMRGDKVRIKEGLYEDIQERVHIVATKSFRFKGKLSVFLEGQDNIFALDELIKIE